MARVFVADKLENVGLELLHQAGLEVDYRPGLKGEELRRALQRADGMIVRSGTRVTADLLEQPGQLRAIVRAGVGVDNIDVAAATRRGIVVMNTPGGNTVSTAEHTWALILSLVRHVPAADASVRAGKWERQRFIGMQLAGKTLGVVGVGRIGREVARRALAFDMKVLAYDPFLTAERAAQLGIEPAPSLHALLPHCDIVTLHVPLTDQTRQLLGAREISLMKRGAYLINCARGGVVDETALVEALQSGQLAGAALDVFAEEPPAPDSPLLNLPNVVLTPHLGASTVEAQTSVACEAAQLLIDFLVKGVVQSAVNMATLDAAELRELRWYLDLARRLGLLLTQLSRGAVRKAVLTYRGDVANRNTRLVTAAFAAGLLEPHLADSVNIVNAELLARERQIELVEQVSSLRGDFSSLIRAEVETEQGTLSAAGTLFGKQYLRVVQLGQFHLDAYLDGILMIFQHRDAPGLIGFIGTVLGRHQVNIAQMNVGRVRPGGEAVAILNLDSLPPEEALEEVRRHPLISSVHVVKLPPPGQTPSWLG
ncbi:MAG: phosphoglycerate dehydrogenase [Gemmatales bacterium]|nr:phosphoglycerate dehydrogenase [Gemmatales bacterium]MDW7994788.1 phosphoglycerate dehydrogenase [Gemmatales bacterium]